MIKDKVFLYCHDCEEMFEVGDAGLETKDWIFLHVGHALGVTDDDRFCYV